MSKILKTKIENYKSIKELDLELNIDLNVFVGSNNSGKTNILNCIFEALNLENNDKFFQSISRLQNYERSYPKVTLFLNNDESFCFNNNSSNYLTYNLKDEKLINSNAINRVINKFSIAVVDSYIDINKIINEMYNFFEGIEDEEVSIILSYINRDLTIISNEFYSISIVNDKIFVADNYGDTAPINEKSNGVIKLVFMSYFLNKFNVKNKEVPDIVFFDEPETHLHIEAQRYLYEKIKDVFSKSQIMISTHSTAFVSDTDLNKIFLVERDAVNGTIIDYKKRDKKKLLKINEIMGVNIFDTLSMDITSTLVMVEGKTDRFYHEYIYQKLYPTKKKKFVEVEGANKITDFISVYKEVYPTRPFGILDYDNKGLDMAKRIKSKFSSEFDNKILVNNNCLIKDLEKNSCKPEEEIEVEDLFDFEFLKKSILNLLEKQSFNKEELKQAEKILEKPKKFNQIEKELDNLKLPSTTSNYFSINKYDLSIVIKNNLEKLNETEFKDIIKKFSDLYSTLNKNTGG